MLCEAGPEGDPCGRSFPLRNESTQGDSADTVELLGVATESVISDAMIKLGREFLICDHANVS